MSPTPEQSARREPFAVLVHGIMDTGRIFRPLMRVLGDAGIDHIAPNLRPSHGGERIEALAGQLDRTIRREIPDDAPLHLVGFSMGALIARYFIQSLGGDQRTKRFYSVAAPHAGSWWCHWHPLPGARQMRPSSDFLRRLNGDVSCFERIPTVAYWTPLDLVVVPHRSSLLPFAENVRILSPCHQCLLSDRRLLSDIRARMLATRSQPAETMP
jgi:triacylglycerol lipase